ncbi:MAG: hypothetical protein KGL42_14055 [Betaproteobacteria bacterium]|nr:hypothetical protein [Betaproteobacteria bacterium]
MATLSTSQRKHMPQSYFALPGRRFPIPDASHAEAALRDAPRAVNAGNISRAQEATVDRKAHAFLKRHPIQR